MINKQQALLALTPLGEYKEGYNQYKFNCPNCEKNGGLNDKFNLELKIDGDNAFYHCWSCNIHGTLSNLVKTYGYKEYHHYFKTKKNNLEEVTDSVLELPPHIAVYSEKAAYSYLLNERHLSPELIKQRNIKYCYTGPYKGYIIFPSYNADGKLTYFNAHNPSIGKYKEKRGLEHTCFYESFIDKNAPIILTEGIYDSLSVPNSIPLLGLKISKQLLDFVADRIVILAVDSVVDDDVKRDIEKKLNSTCSKLIVFNVSKYKDLNEIFVKDQEKLKNNLINCYEF